MAVKAKRNDVYGLDGLLNIIGGPIIAKRAPTTKDQAPLGTTWINKSTYAAYVCCGVVANVAHWSPAAALVAPVVIAGNLSVTGTTTLTGVVTMTAGVTGLLATDGAITAATTIGAGTDIAAGGTIASVGDITTDGAFEAEDDITTSDGDLVVELATKGLILPGPVKISTGAGAPANPLATAIGDMYIRTDAGAANERLYIATGVGAWTTVDCAA